MLKIDLKIAKIKLKEKKTRYGIFISINRIEQSVVFLIIFTILVNNKESAVDLRWCVTWLVVSAALLLYSNIFTNTLYYRLYYRRVLDKFVALLNTAKSLNFNRIKFISYFIVYWGLLTFISVGKLWNAERTSAP